MKKKKLAFLLGISSNLGFAAGNVALSLWRYMPQQSYEMVVLYSSLSQADAFALRSIPNVTIRQFKFDARFERTMLKMLPNDHRFRSRERLMTFTHFEVFSLLNEYETVVWLDADISIQRSLEGIHEFSPFGITLDDPWLVKNYFLRPLKGYDVERPGVCSAVIVVCDSLPYQELHSWCYAKTLELAPWLHHADQAIFNLAIQEFGVTPTIMPLKEWQCIAWRPEGKTARIVHFGTERKVWNDENIARAYPDWFQVHLQWLERGGTDFVRPGV